ncbi:hypothetical protein VCJ_001828 [Vibrio metoecus]|nr:hypothetical protein VCJ_001828 [Vibrio metoecus]
MECEMLPIVLQRTAKREFNIPRKAAWHPLSKMMTTPDPSTKKGD